jgi:hypothetical protein
MTRKRIVAIVVALVSRCQSFRLEKMNEQEMQRVCGLYAEGCGGGAPVPEPEVGSMEDGSSGLSGLLMMLIFALVLVLAAAVYLRYVRRRGRHLEREALPVAVDLLALPPVVPGRAILPRNCRSTYKRN